MFFKDIIGSPAATSTILQAIAENRLPHAMLLRGPEGVGKWAFANALSQYVNCLAPIGHDSCGTCASCRKISQSLHPDVHYILPTFSKEESGRRLITDDYLPSYRKLYGENPFFHLSEWGEEIEGDKKQLIIPIDEIRNLKKKLMLIAFEGKYKIVLIYHSELMNINASNALLKLLEEPPPNTLFLLTASNEEFILPTINSRCQSIYFRKLPKEALANYLVEKRNLPNEMAQDVATLADGNINKAIDILLHSKSAFSDNYIVWMQLCYKGGAQQIDAWTKEMIKNTKEYLKLYLEFAMQKLRDALLYRFDSRDMALVSSAKEREFMPKFANFLDLQGIEKINELIENSLYYITRNANSTIVLYVLSFKIHNILHKRY